MGSLMGKFSQCLPPNAGGDGKLTRHWLQRSAVLGSFILLITAALYVDQLNTRNLELHHRDTVQRDLGAISARLEANLRGDIQAAKALIAAVRQHSDLDPTFLNDYAATLIEGEGRLRSVAVMRGYIGAFVYPFKGNEPVLGMDIRNHPDQRADLDQVLAKGKPRLSGPVQLIQGGSALIARLPAHIDNSGQALTVSAVIDIPKLLQGSGIGNDDQSLNIAVRKLASHGNPSLHVFGDPELFRDDSRAVISEIPLAYGQRWQLAAAPSGGWQSGPPITPFRLLVTTVSLLIFSAIGLISWLLSKRYESNQLLEQLFEMSPIGIALNDYESGRFISVNSALRENLGYPDQEIEQLNYHDLTPEEFREKDQRALKTLQQCGRLGPYEKELIRADGSRITIENHSILFRDSQGKLLIWSMVEDISARKHAETAMARQQEMLNSMSRQARIGAWELEVDTGKVSWSATTREIFGVDTNFDPNAENMRKYYPDNTMWESLTRHIRQAIHSGEVFSEELKVITANGEQIWLQVTGQPEFRNGRCTRIFGSFQDINERKCATEAMVLARDEAEKAARSKSEFLATMSHEIRTPMNGVLGMLNLLASSKLDFEQERRISIARSSAHALLSLIDDVLDFSRIDAGKMTLENGSFQLRELIEEICESMSLRAQEKGLELVVDLSDIDIDTVCGDAGRLRQVLNNLLGNALKFTEHGEVVLRATLRDAGERWQFHCAIIDTGIGITEAQLDTLFSAFTQADASTTRKYGGSGLGLSISQKICQAMGGEITAQSREQQGSCFSIDLPLDKDPTATRDLAVASNRCIWIIEDNASACDSLRRQLQRWGAQVHCSMSSEEALEAADKHSFALDSLDLVIIDRYMHGLDGTELVQFLRQEEHLSRVPIALLCNIGNQGTDAHFRSLGFDAWYPKPLSIGNLRKLLNLDPESACAPPHTHSKPVSQADNNLQGQRILLVEDNAVNQEVVRCLLEEFGLQVSIAANGIQAIDKLKPQDESRPPYSAVLMDCQMPEMDGYECTRQIRAGLAGEAARELPIIALTANALSGDREKCSAAGMNDYLSKPIEPDRLLAKLQSWLTRRPYASAAEPGSTQAPQDAIWRADLALESVMGQEKTLKRMLQMFNDYSQPQQRALRNAITTADTDAIARISRALKGSSGQLQGTVLHKAASAMENAASDADWEKIHYYYPLLHQHWQQLCDCFERHLNSDSEDPLRNQVG